MEGNGDKWLGPTEGRYANYFEVGFTSEEIVLDFGQHYEAGNNVVFHTRIVTSPFYARELSGLLTKTLTDYADSFGSKTVGGTAPVDAAEPAAESGGADSEAAVELADAVALPPPARFAVRLAAAPAAAALDGVSSVLGQAVTALLDRLQMFLPNGGDPPPSVSIVSVEDRSVGLGQWRGLGVQNNFPIALKGILVNGLCRFQLWSSQPEDARAGMAALIDQLLSQADALFRDGFLKIKLKSTSAPEQVQTPAAWRVMAEFEVLYEFDFQDTDGAGGLITQIPAEFRDAFGSSVTTGDVVIWNEQGAATLRLNGARSVKGLASLSFSETAFPADGVRIVRTFQGATAPPASFPSLNDFLAATGGPSPASRNAEVAFASLDDFLAALDPPQDSMEFRDENDAPREFVPREFAFDPGIELGSKADRLEVVFTGSSLSAGQILYLRAMRGTTST